MNHPNQLLVKSYSDIALNKEDTILSSRESTAVSQSVGYTPGNRPCSRRIQPRIGVGTPSASFRYSRARWS